MNRSNGRIKPIGVFGVVQILLMAAALWFMLWAFTGIFTELFHYLTNIH